MGRLRSFTSIVRFAVGSFQRLVPPI